LRQHNGHQLTRTGGAPKGNTNAVRHGVYSEKLLSAQEEEHFADITDRLRRDFPSADESLIHEAAMYNVRTSRAFNSGKADAMRKMDSKLRKALKKLKSPEPVRREITTMTREEWMEGLLAKMDESAHSR
jgi:uncharacterized protein YjcR